MHLQNEGLTGKTFIMNDFSIPNKLPSLKQKPEVNRVRKIVLILISILLVLCFIDFIFVLISFATSRSLEGESSKSIVRSLSLLLSIVYYGFGLYSTYHYYQTGLLVFAWSGLLFLTAFAVIIVVAIIVVITSSNVGFAAVILGVIITIIVYLIASLLQIFTVRYAFVLSKLLKNAKPLTSEQI